MDSLRQDLRYALRALRRSPGFAAVAVLTLALGIGANTAIFSVLNAVVLRPLPMPEPGQLTHLGWDWGQGATPSLTEHKFEYWRENNQSFQGIATWSSFTAEGPEGYADQGVSGLTVSEDFFRVVGMQPLLGRAFTAEEYQQRNTPVAVLGHEMWSSHFRGDPGVLGEEIELNGRPYTVVGVMPPEFRLPQVTAKTGVLRPRSIRADPEDLGHNSPALARMRPGVTLQQAQSDLDRVLASYREDYPRLAGNEREAMRLMSYDDIYLGGVRGLLWLLLGAIGFVLLIACANVANLLLARATERHREISVRLALGAGRGRILRQLLTESVVIAVIAAIVGIGLAAWGVDALLRLSPTPLPRQDEIGMDLPVLLFTVLLASVTGLLFGLAAGIPASRPEVAGALREGSRSAGAARGVGRIRSALVVAQAALAVVLLSGAGLLISTFANLRSVDTGFRADEVLAVSFSRAPVELSSAESITRFQQRVEDELAALPGVQSVATTSVVPFAGQLNLPMMVVGRENASETAIQWRAVSPDFFQTLEIGVRQGRAFTAADRAGGAGVIIINEATANHYFPGENPIGQRIEVGATPTFRIPGLEEPVREIVGVVADTRVMGLRQDPVRMIYVPQAQVPDMFASLPSILVRTSQPARTGRALPAAIQAMDPRLPTPRVRTMNEIVGTSMASERFVGTLLTLFAALALLLTAVGIYGVIAYNARQRTREIGVRMALGATALDVLRLVTRQGIAPVLVGLVAGVVVAMWATGLVEGLLFGVQTNDPLNFLLVALLLATVALAASLIPAYRATRVDPMTALRQD